MKKVIIYVGEIELPDKNAAAQRVLANCKIINESNSKDVVIIGLNSSISDSTDFSIIDTFFTLDEFGVYEYPYPKTSLQWFRFIMKIDHIINVVNHIGVDNIYAVIAYNYPAIALERLRKYCTKNNIAIISDVTEWYGKSKRRFPSNIVKDLDTFLRMRYSNKRCINVICASKYLESYYSKFNCNTLNIPSLVDDTNPKFHVYNESYNSGIKTYSYVGTPGKSKEKDKLDWIINSFHKLSNYKYRLILAGITENLLFEYYPELKDKVFELDGKIEFKGKVNHQTAIKIVANSDFSIFAREVNRVTSAGFPTKLAEAYACKTPVITTPSSNIKDYIENNKTGFVSESCDESSFYDVILESLLLNEQDISLIKEHLLNNNPLRISNFYNVCKQFFSDLF